MKAGESTSQDIDYFVCRIRMNIADGSELKEFVFTAPANRAGTFS